LCKPSENLDVEAKQLSASLKLKNLWHSKPMPISKNNTGQVPT